MPNSRNPVEEMVEGVYERGEGKRSSSRLCLVTHRYSWPELMNSQETAKELVWDQPRSSTSGWQFHSLIFCGPLAVRPRPSLMHHMALWNYLELFSLDVGVRGEFGPASTWYAMSYWFPWEALPHLNGAGGGVYARAEEKSGEGMGRESGGKTVAGL